MLSEEKIKHLAVLNENQFRKSIVLPVLRIMDGIESVLDNHGANEHGIDVVFFDRPPLSTTPTCVGVILKVGDITQMDNSRGKYKVTEIKDQITLAADNDLNLVNPAGKFRASRLIVMTTGKISNQAQTQLSKHAQNSHRLNLQAFDGSSVIGLIDKYYGEYWQFFDKTVLEYYRKLTEDYKYIEDISKLGVQEVKLVDDIYVPMTVSEILEEGPVQLDSGDPDISRMTGGSETISEVRLLDNEHRKVLLIGTTGSGKRIVLRHLLSEQIKLNGQGSDSDIIPFLLDAKDLKQSQTSLRDYLDHYLQYHDGGQLRDGFEKRLTETGVLILVDKLSRVNGSGEVLKLLETLDQFCVDYPKTRVVVALRDSQASEASEATNFKRYRLNFFGTSQVSTLVQNWYKDKIGVDLLPYEVVVQQLIRNVSQSALPKTPLVFTLNLVLLDSEESKTSNIADLFDKYCDLHLGKWNQELNLPFKYEFRQKKLLLSELAHFMQETQTDILPKENVLALFGKRIKQMGVKIQAEEILAETIAGGILLPEGNFIRFTLYVLQEFFVGVYLRDMQTDSKVASKLDDTFWGMPIIFYSGLKRECNALLEEIVTLKETPNISLQAYRSYMAGMIASNADHTDSDLKKEAIRFAFLGYVTFQKRLAVILSGHYGQIGELYAGIFLDTLAFYGLGSPLLELQYKELLTEKLAILEGFDEEIIPLSETEKEMPMFLIASLLTRFGLDGHVEALEQILASPNPYILVLLHSALHKLKAQRPEISKLNPELPPNWKKISGIQTRLKRKLQKEMYRDARRHLLRRNRNAVKKGFILPPPERALQRPGDYLEKLEDSTEE